MHEAQAVIQKFDGFVLKGKKLQVQPAEEKVPAHGKITTSGKKTRKNLKIISFQTFMALW